MRILLVEDDRSLADIVASGLEEKDIRVTVAHNFADGRMEAVLNTFDVIVLDVMLPGGSGFDLCKYLREREIATPILMLTARNAVDDRVAGLEAGADDYLANHLRFASSSRGFARSREERRRRSATSSRLPTSRSTWRTESETRRKDIELTAKEFSLLEFFVLNAGHVVDRAAITAHVWDDNHDPFTNVLEVLVRRLGARSTMTSSRSCCRQ
jgi:Response regulators consisting of a CheY-like receiver domain and a winged-helix DNA-binding domain